MRLNIIDTIQLAVSGCRTYLNQDDFDAKMDAWVTQYGRPVRIITGGARGTDTLAVNWAMRNNIPMTILTPDYYYSQGYGRRAPLMRNSDIINAATHVIAFPSVQSRGTRDAIRKAQAAGKPLVVHEI